MRPCGPRLGSLSLHLRLCLRLPRLLPRSRCLDLGRCRSRLDLRNTQSRSDLWKPQNHCSGLRREQEREALVSCSGIRQAQKRTTPQKRLLGGRSLLVLRRAPHLPPRIKRGPYSAFLPLPPRRHHFLRSRLAGPVGRGVMRVTCRASHFRLGRRVLPPRLQGL